jgi:hypothetical protein
VEDPQSGSDDTAPEPAQTEPEAKRLPRWMADRYGIPTSPELVRLAKKAYRRVRRYEAAAASDDARAKFLAEGMRLLRFMMEHAGKLDENELADFLEEIEGESGVAH